MSFLQSLADRLRVRFSRGGEFESLALRESFRRRHNLRIGLYSYGCFDRWRVPPGTVIGRYCSFARSVRLVETNHPTGSLTSHPFLYLNQLGVDADHRAQSGHKVLEDDVWLGHNVTVLPGCKRIGRSAVIGAGSVLTTDVPRYGVMVGSPAKLVRYRFPPAIQAAIEATRWWELDKQTLTEGLKAAPKFALQPDVESARAFFRAVHGRELELDESGIVKLPRIVQSVPKALVASG
jgi:acetyltransferase-like isoleucine patch superfamily enzyme